MKTSDYIRSLSDEGLARFFTAIIKDVFPCFICPDYMIGSKYCIKNCEPRLFEGMNREVDVEMMDGKMR